MNDVREAIDRLGARFEQGGRFDDLAGRRRRARIRRRGAVAAFALVIAAGGWLAAVRAFPPATPRSPMKVRVAATWSTASSATPAAVAGVQRTCPTPSGDSPGQVLFSTTSAPAGSSVDVSVTFQTGESWLQLWWNADEDTFPSTIDPPPYPPTGPDLTFGPLGPGPVVKLASLAGPTQNGDCAFQTKVTIPDVSPGTYQIESVFGGPAEPQGSGGYFFLYGPLTFEVTG